MKLFNLFLVTLALSTIIPLEILSKGEHVLERSSLPFEQRLSPTTKKYLEFYEESIKDPEKFWDGEARKLEWFRMWDKVLDWDQPFARWFVGGLQNASYLCLDKHVKTWWRSKVQCIGKTSSATREP